MIRMSIGLTRLPALTQEEFLDHWRNQHAPLVTSVSGVLGIRKYTQLVPLSGSECIHIPPGSRFDGVAEIDFDSVEIVTSGHRSEEARAAIRQLAMDEAAFVDTEKSVRWWGRVESIL